MIFHDVMITSWNIITRTSMNEMNENMIRNTLKIYRKPHHMPFKIFKVLGHVTPLLIFLVTGCHYDNCYDYYNHHYHRCYHYPHPYYIIYSPITL